jgi:hypothetical protein
VLHGGTQNAADENENEEPHQESGERAPKVKSAMHQDQRKAQEAQPEVAPHPALGTANAPDRKFLAKSKETCEEHQRESQTSIG